MAAELMALRERVNKVRDVVVVKIEAEMDICRAIFARILIDFS